MKTPGRLLVKVEEFVSLLLDFLTFFHLSGIFGTQDDHLLLGKVNGNGGTRGHTLSISIGRERSCIVNGIIWVEVFEIFSIRSNEHIAHEKSVIGTSAYDSNLDSIFLVPSGETIDNIDTIPGI